MLEFVLHTFYLHCIDRFAYQFPQGHCGDLGGFTNKCSSP
jgi:hypothetical protein